MESYNEFKNLILKTAGDALEGEAEVLLHSVRSNKEKEDLLVIRREGEQTAPGFSVNKLYEAYKEYGMIRVLKILLDSLEDIKNVEQPDLTKEGARANTFIQLLSIEGNAELLEDTLFRALPGTDLVQVIRYRCGEDGTFLVKRPVAELLGIPEKELFEFAAGNTGREDWIFESLEKKMMGILEMETPEELDERGLYYLSNRAGVMGAAVITIPRCLETIRSRLGRNFYILPSSIHEVMILPEHIHVDPDLLAENVREINRIQVAPEDQLSDHVYFFDGQRIRMVR